MSNAKHTPGPWFAAMGQFDYGNDGSRRIMFGDPSGDTYGRIGTVDTKAPRIHRGKKATPYDAPDAERDANARLIAAAPELLEALENLLAITNNISLETVAARHVIAKAKGE